MVPADRSQVTAEEKRAALNDVLGSATLARSDRLKNLLRCLCEAEMEGRTAELTEHAIGVQALKQPESYSPTENSTVRSRVYELRRRLEKFYSTEAPGAPLRIELAKGSYVPRFVRQSPAAPATISRRSGWWMAAAFAAGALAMFAALRGLLGTPRPVRAKSATASVWTGIGGGLGAVPRPGASGAGLV